MLNSVPSVGLSFQRSVLNAKITYTARMGCGWRGCLCVRRIPPRARVPGDKQLTAQLYVLAEERFKRQTPAQRWPHNSPEECIELATIYALPPSGAEPPGALLEREARNRRSLTRAYMIAEAYAELGNDASVADVIARVDDWER